MWSKTCTTTEVCCEKGALTEDSCGWGASGGEEAQEAGYGEFPWMVAILTVEANETWSPAEYIGGGSIISPRVVLTAAHKLAGRAEPEIKCRAGEWVRSAREEHAPQDRLVAKIIIHPEYNRLYMANDVALLGLAEPFSVSQPAVAPVCVGRGAPLDPECFAMGWGRLADSKQYADKLKKVRAPLVSLPVCWRALQAVHAARRRQRARQAVDDVRRCARSQSPAEQRELHASLRCAGGEGPDACAGDGGAPLVCRVQSNATHTRWAVFGVVAWGVGCGERGVPGVYADVARFHDWILRNLSKL